jgi:hypothetical protein
MMRPYFIIGDPRFNYQRIYIPGGTNFITLVTYKRLSFLTSKQASKVLRESWQRVQEKWSFFLIAMCLVIRLESTIPPLFLCASGA